MHLLHEMFLGRTRLSHGARAIRRPPRGGAGGVRGIGGRPSRPPRGRFDVVVVGGGHAGTEAAAAAARVGAATLLITQKAATIGEMSCNPSFGGIGKGHLIREIDALDGLCARICDQAGIHFKILNRRKGPAVWGLRAQMDRKLYRKYMQNEISSIPGLTVWEASVEDLLLTDSDPSRPGKWKLRGVVLGDGTHVETSCVALTTGTFMRGVIGIGLDLRPAGRLGDDPSSGLAETLDKLGFRVGRLKTAGGTVAMLPDLHGPLCRGTRQGQSSPQPTRPGDQSRPQVLPLSRVEDPAIPQSLSPVVAGARGPGLRHRLSPGPGDDLARLSAGGTGQEDPGPGGGPAAAARVRGTVRLYRPPPASPQLGDLPRPGPLLCRSGEWDNRLRGGSCPGYREAGCVSRERYEAALRAREALEEAAASLKALRFSGCRWRSLLPEIHISPNRSDRVSAYEMLRHAMVGMETLSALFPETLGSFSGRSSLAQRLKIEATYEPLVIQQQQEIDEVRRDEGMRLPEDLNYEQISASLSREVREQLEIARPQTIGAASRIPGVTPAAIVNLLRFVKSNYQDTVKNGLRADL